MGLTISLADDRSEPAVGGNMATVFSHSILAVGVSVGPSVARRDTEESCEDSTTRLLCSVESGRIALDLVRIADFDLAVVGATLPDMSMWAFVNEMKRACPAQRWLLAANAISDKDEVRARTLGAIGVFGSELDWSHLNEMARQIHEWRVSHPLPPGPGVV